MQPSGCILLPQQKGSSIMSMSSQPKSKTDQAMIDEFLNKGGKITKGKTKPMPNELGISNVSWNKKLTKIEKQAKEGK